MTGTEDITDFSADINKCSVKELSQSTSAARECINQAENEHHLGNGFSKALDIGSSDKPENQLESDVTTTKKKKKKKKKSKSS
ncbi:hypothetical protein GJ496_007969 [Pomphorhynchus laevis]|nr:hypothetical protein GJ496_007969 [Pomphorhynchus laevis]